MNMHDDEVRLLLQRVVVGDLRPEDPRVQRALAAHPGLRAELDAMLSAQQVLDATAAQEKRTLALAESIDAPTIDVERDLRALARARAPSPGRKPRLWSAGLAAAVVVLALAWWWRQGDVADVRPRAILDGASEIEIVSCLPAPAGYRLTWRDKGAAAHYKVQVAGVGLDRQSEQIDQPEWTVSAESTAGWPREVTFTVHAFDELGRRLRPSAPKTIAWPP